MLQDTWGNYPLGCYRSPYLSHLVTKEQELESVYQYYKKHNLNRAYPKNKIMFMKDGDNYVGIFTLNEVGNTLECNLAGILKPYRSGMYFHDEMNFKKEYCIKNGFESFTFGARNENAAVQRIFQHLGFETAGNDNVFHITSLLTFSKAPAVTELITTTHLSAGQTGNLLYTVALQQGEQHLPNYTKSLWQLNNDHLLASNPRPRHSVYISCSNPYRGFEWFFRTLRNQVTLGYLRLSFAEKLQRIHKAGLANACESCQKCWRFAASYVVAQALRSLHLEKYLPLTPSTPAAVAK